jgi:DNA excision repair protein ERCC-4
MHCTMEKVIVDHRENADVLIDSLKNQYCFNVEITTLKLGDYFLEPDITVERKTTNDFIVSIIDGRLFNQAHILVKYAKRPIMIVEGRHFNLGKFGISAEPVNGALITLAQTFYIPVLRTIDEKDTAWHLNQLYLQRKRVGEQKGSLFGYKGKKIETQKVHLLRTLPGIGNKTAKDLLDYFESITDIVNASEKELQNVPGIGRISARRIKNMVSEELEEYNHETH